MNLTELAERVATEQSLDKAQARKMIEAAPKAVVEVRPIPGERPSVIDVATRDHPRSGARSSAFRARNPRDCSAYPARIICDSTHAR